MEISPQLSPGRGSNIGSCTFIWCSCVFRLHASGCLITDLVLGSRSVGFTSTTFFSQSQMSQSSLNWHILNAVQGRQCHIVFPNIVQNCSTWPKLARQKCWKLLEMTQAGAKKLLKIAQNCSKLLRIDQSCSKLLKIVLDSRCFKMFQNGPTSVQRGDVLA